jgi:CRP/FNR family transcriptional regulator, cyclic AMP receptor protein
LGIKPTVRVDCVMCGSAQISVDVSTIDQPPPRPFRIIDHGNISRLARMAFLTKQITNGKKAVDFDPHAFLSTIGKGRDMLSFQKKDVIFAQGDGTDGLFFIQKGKVRLSVVSEVGKEATLGILGEADFFGEGGLAGQLLRMSSATAMTDCVLLHIEKNAMMAGMNREPTLSAMFLKYLLKRNIRYQEDLVDQLFNSSEKRLARVLLLMAHFGKKGVSEMVVPRLSQETLAEMVGTTRSRVSFFMNRFRKFGFINYDVGDNLHVHSSLLNVVLHDENGTSANKGHAAELTGPGADPPSRPGGAPDKNRARRPPLRALKRAQEATA